MKHDEHISGAARYWAGNLDPQNLERGPEASPGISIEDEIAFAGTPDLMVAHDWLKGAPQPASGPFAGAFVVLDLGAGMGANAFALTRLGARIIAVDTSTARLRELMRRAALAGCADRITPVAAAAEALPFAGDSVPNLFTKSVLIHTNLPVAAAEIARVLPPGGRAALDEPQPGNPFAWLYRRTLAPKEWQGITRYFDRWSHRACLSAIGPGSVRPLYLFSFLAFVFQFALPRRKLFFFTLGVLGAVDAALFRLLPILGRLAWFGVVRTEKGQACGMGADDLRNRPVNGAR